MKAVRHCSVLRFASLCKPPPLYRLSPPIVHRFRHFHTTSLLERTQTHVLSDIGEGVKEVQIIQWFIEEGAAVEEWAPLCEVQSDKASVEITSKYTGVVKKLHFDRDAIVQVGDAMLDIEVEEEDTAEPSEEESEQETGSQMEMQELSNLKEHTSPSKSSREMHSISQRQGISSDKSSSIATPAVRGLLKEHKLEINDIKGTGKDGRVLKEDVYRHLEGGKVSEPATTATAYKPELSAEQVETKQNLTTIQSAMFKSMTKSLAIPHFLFSEKIDVTILGSMRKRLNVQRNPEKTPKFTYLPFVIKAVSLALNQYPILNARLDLSKDDGKPGLLMRANHNIGVAMDTPAGLLVPVIKNVNARSITSIAEELARLSGLGQAGKLSKADLNGGTITVSNIGNIGGEVVAPVIVEGQLAILGIGKIKPTPIFADDGTTVKRADLMSTSWSADHRIVDGATMARAARLVQSYIEQPEIMLVDMS